MSVIQTTGKRKTSIARVYMSEGEGKITINKDRTLEQHFPREAHQRAVVVPLNLTERLEKYDIKVNVKGGGPTGQAEAIRHGIARALVEAEGDELRDTLKKAGLLTRDARIVERKKYGRHKARRSCQFSKR
ncbi:MAG: 30S ribosomal protein S9 [Deltaproteobacteria bacterium]|nr:MAG: 30S ribosomal protein S9 [Deltaproteobacteria bacterium]PLX45031.1 MAG: 30S ribosomal protein S9 [Deltaproteobacteria bacterium]